MDTFLNSPDQGLPLSNDYLSKFVQHFYSFITPYCEETEDLHYLAHLTASNVARDLDLVRNLTGYQTLDFYGQDYGTVIGTTYAGLFPDRVGRMVLDGGTTRMNV